MKRLQKQLYKFVLLNMFPERKSENSFVNARCRVPLYKDMSTSWNVTGTRPRQVAFQSSCSIANSKRLLDIIHPLRVFDRKTLLYTVIPTHPYPKVAITRLTKQSPFYPYFCIFIHLFCFIESFCRKNWRQLGTNQRPSLKRPNCVTLKSGANLILVCFLCFSYKQKERIPEEEVKHLLDGENLPSEKLPQTHRL